MLKITEEEKKLFFEDITPIRRQYNFFIVTKGFIFAEEFKKTYIREYILKNKDRLLNLRDRIYGSK